MKILPEDRELQKHINHYWVVENCSDLFSQESRVYGYPGIRPEIIIIIDGYLQYTYLGKKSKTDQSILASHIRGSFLFDSSCLKRFAIVQFKPRSLSSLLPFTNYSADQLMHNSICKLTDVFGKEVKKLESDLKRSSLSESKEIFDSFFIKRLKRDYVGFLIEMLCDLRFDENTNSILQKMGCSISSLERYVKKEVGMTPKAFLNLRKYKLAVEEMCDTQSQDWPYFVEKYNYFDQSHFIKSVKKYTGFTPTQLVTTPNLIALRPEYF